MYNDKGKDEMFPNQQITQFYKMKTKSVVVFIITFCFAFPMKVQMTILHKFIDVKGNDAIREVRILYNLFEQNNNPESLPTTDNPIKVSSGKANAVDVSPYTYSWPEISINSHKISQQQHPSLVSSRPNVQPSMPVQSHHQHYQTNVQLDSSTLKGNQPIGTITSHVYHPQYYLEQSLSRPITSMELMPNRFKLQNIQPHPLIRGRPLFAEIDFVPRYIPQMTYYVAVSVTLPAHIRGRPWILGWHQEVFPIPACRLCTNKEQSFTLPVTLFLPDDGWCPEGRVPTIWKVEAIARENNGRFMDQTDMNLAYGYDELRQLHILNDVNSTAHCRGISEAIIV